MPENQKQFREILKQKGLKVTTQRITILEVLQKRPGEHMTAEEIYDCVREKYPDIGLATVYRTIQLLSELQLIDKLTLDDGFVRYEIGKAGRSGREHHHHHLICLSCGKIAAFEDDLLDRLEQRIKETAGFEVVDHEVKIFGYCRECTEKQEMKDL